MSYETFYQSVQGSVLALFEGVAYKSSISQYGPVYFNV